MVVGGGGADGVVRLNVPPQWLWTGVDQALLDVVYSIYPVVKTV